MPFINDMLEDRQHQQVVAPSPVTPRKSRFLFDPSTVMQLLHARIVGQDAMKQVVDDMLYVVKADLASPGKPLSTMLFLGPTGVGKTETVRILAEAIHGSADAICRIDMNTLSQQHYAAALSGAPPGYVGSKEGHTLFNKALVEGTFSKPGIVLFDELEKADRDVVRTILNALDTGRLQLAGGTGELDFRNSLVFMTSNIGVRDNRSPGWWSQFSTRLSFQRREKHFLGALKRHFDPEFLNRIDHTIIFDDLGDSLLDSILDIEVKKLEQRLSGLGLTLELHQSVKDAIKANYQQEYGARDIARNIRQFIEVPLSRLVLEGVCSSHLLISWTAAKIRIQQR